MGITNRKGVRPSVRKGLELMSELVCKLELGSSVQIIEIKQLPSRIRGLVEEPRGWMSLCTTASEANQFAWAERCELNRAGAPVSIGSTGKYYCGRNMSSKNVASPKTPYQRGTNVAPWLCGPADGKQCPDCEHYQQNLPEPPRVTDVDEKEDELAKL